MTRGNQNISGGSENQDKAESALPETTRNVFLSVEKIEKNQGSLMGRESGGD